jgi:hypothetical protein
MSKIKRKSFIVMLGASAVGAYSLMKSPLEIFKTKVMSAAKEKSSVKFKENPHSIKRQNNS